MYNRVLRPMTVFDSTDTWSYTTDTIRQANGAAGNKVEFFVGISENALSAALMASVNVASNTRGAKAGIGLDATNALHGVLTQAYNSNAGSITTALAASLKTIPAVGYHYLSWNEKGADSTSTFVGDNGGVSVQSGLTAEVWA
jgi:hypothetical protein